MNRVMGWHFGICLGRLTHNKSRQHSIVATVQHGTTLLTTAIGAGACVLLKDQFFALTPAEQDMSFVRGFWTIVWSAEKPGSLELVP